MTCFLGPIATRTPRSDVFSRSDSDGNPGPSRGGGAGVGAEQGRGRRVGRGKTSMPIGPIKHDTSCTSEAQTHLFLSLLDENVPNSTRQSPEANGGHGNSGPGTRPGKELVLIYIVAATYCCLSTRGPSCDRLPDCAWSVLRSWNWRHRATPGLRG